MVYKIKKEKRFHDLQSTTKKNKIQQFLNFEIFIHPSQVFFKTNNLEQIHQQQKLKKKFRSF